MSGELVGEFAKLCVEILVRYGQSGSAVFASCMAVSATRAGRGRIVRLQQAEQSVQQGLQQLPDGRFHVVGKGVAAWIGLSEHFIQGIWAIGLWVHYW